MSAPPPPDASHEACDRFMAIEELILAVLEQAHVLTLVNCQRVCTHWKELIEDSQVLQESLFLSPVVDSTPKADARGFQDTRPEISQLFTADQTTASKRILNPVLAECFAPILGSTNLASSEWCSYEDCSSLPWAKAGAQLDSSSRAAFMRGDASWRGMLVAQPPIYRLNWWHEWRTSNKHIAASGHQDFYPEHVWATDPLTGRRETTAQPITIGMLYDLVESRLKRGCFSRVVYWPEGKAIESDPTACPSELRWISESHPSQHHGLNPSLPRIKIMTRQIWHPQPPIGNDFYDFGLGRWLQGPQQGDPNLNRHVLDGFNVLREDCKRDHDQNIAERWSRSEGFQYSEIDGESSYGGYAVTDQDVLESWDLPSTL